MIKTISRVMFGCLGVPLLSLWATSASITVPSQPSTSQPSVKLTPERIEMGAFVGGVRVKISGIVSTGSKAIVVITGAEKREYFNKQGRFGFLWLNAGSIRISGAPSMFLCFSPEPIRALLDGEVIGEKLLDVASIQDRLQIAPRQNPDQVAQIQSSFLALKAQSDLYHVYPGGLKMGEPGADGTPYSAEFLWPKVASPASYMVKVLEYRDRTVIGEASIPLDVVRVGFPRVLSVLATQYAPYYGALAVVLAICAGFTIDFLAAKLFGKRGVVAH